MKISIIAAIDQKRGIGKNNHLLFRIPEDFEQMKRLTYGHPIIMGRRTFESKEIGRILPNRINIIVTRDPTYKVLGAIVCRSLEEALQVAKEKEALQQAQGKQEIFIFGGGQIYTQALPLVERLYLTIVEGDFGADTFFPDYSAFKKVIFEKPGQSGKYRYKFLILEKGNSA